VVRVIRTDEFEGIYDHLVLCVSVTLALLLCEFAFRALAASCIEAAPHGPTPLLRHHYIKRASPVGDARVVRPRWMRCPGL
jgi:hypothetical protein